MTDTQDIVQDPAFLAGFYVDRVKELIKEMEGDGYTISFEHIRHENLIGQIEHKGGFTICTISKEVETVEFAGESRTLVAIQVHGLAKCSDKDNFCKRTGRYLSFKRALTYVNKHQI